MKESIYTYGTARLAYSQKGRGDVRLVLLHGGFGRRMMWREQIDYFSNEYEVIAPDLLGHGESSKVDAAMAVEENAQVLSAFLRTLPPAREVVLAHSWSGAVLNRLMELRPDMAAAIFVDSSCLAEEEDYLKYTEWSAKISSAPDHEQLIENWFGPLAGANASAEIKELILSEAKRFDPEWVSELMRTYPRPYPVAAGFPIVVQMGSEFFPVGDSKSWQKVFPEAMAWIYSGTGHYYFMTEAEKFNLSLAQQLSALKL